MFNNNYSDPTIVISHANIDENILLLITLSKLKLNTSAFCSNGTCMYMYVHVWIIKKRMVGRVKSKT